MTGEIGSMFCILTAAVFGRSTEIREQPNMSENAILREHLTNVASGDKAAFSELYDLTRTAVYGLALSYMKSAHDAQDITQDTFVRVWESAGQYKPTGSAKSWILTICRNLCLMELRKSGRTKLLDDEEWDAIPEDASGLSFEEKDLLGSALKLLDETERRIVILHAASGLKHREIAKQLDIPLPTVLSKYARAIKKLKKHMEGDDPNE